MPETHDVDETRPVRTADPEHQPEVPTDDSDRSVADYEASDERPGPDHPGKVEKPTDLKRPSVLLAVRRSVREFLDDECTDLAAALTYYSVLAIFPAATRPDVVAGADRAGPERRRRGAQVLQPLVASDTLENIEGPLMELAGSQAAGLALVIGVALRSVLRVELRRRLRAGPEHDLRGRGGAADLEAPPAAAAGHRRHRRDVRRSSLLMLIVSGPVADSIGQQLGVG